MPTHLSPEWIAELDRAAGADESLRKAADGIELVIQQEVFDDHGTAVAWHIVLDHGAVSVRSGRAAQPDVTFSEDVATARAVARGELSAQAAFMVGRLRVGGDVSRLISCQEAFAGIDDCFARVRARTEY